MTDWNASTKPTNHGFQQVSTWHVTHPVVIKKNAYMAPTVCHIIIYEAPLYCLLVCSISTIAVEATLLNFLLGLILEWLLFFVLLCFQLAHFILSFFETEG